MIKEIMRVPCAYQGGKQRLAPQIADILLASAKNSDTLFFDFCCGSAAISIELVNRGVKPSRISMLDISSWGVFWKAIGSCFFNMEIFNYYLDQIPEDKRLFKSHFSKLSALPADRNEAELYPILQANSFGGKQIYRHENKWLNACFRDFWQPTSTSARRSPANPMQPSPNELRKRISQLIIGMKGITCYQQDVMSILKYSLPDNAVAYIDPPYQETTKYAYDFDINEFIKIFMKMNPNIPLFVSESKPLSRKAKKLELRGSNGGITGMRKQKHKEWLSEF